MVLCCFSLLPSVIIVINYVQFEFCFGENVKEWVSMRVIVVTINVYDLTLEHFSSSIIVFYCKYKPSQQNSITCGEKQENTKKAPSDEQS